MVAGKLYKRLRVRMMEMDCTQADLARPIGRSVMYISDRFTGKQQWSQKEIYILCRFLKIPVAQMHEYFPEDGKGEIIVSNAS